MLGHPGGCGIAAVCAGSLGGSGQRLGGMWGVQVHTGWEAGQGHRVRGSGLRGHREGCEGPCCRGTGHCVPWGVPWRWHRWGSVYLPPTQGRHQGPSLWALPCASSLRGQWSGTACMGGLTVSALPARLWSSQACAQQGCGLAVPTAQRAQTLRPGSVPVVPPALSARARWSQCTRDAALAVFPDAGTTGMLRAARLLLAVPVGLRAGSELSAVQCALHV